MMYDLSVPRSAVRWRDFQPLHPRNRSAVPWPAPGRIDGDALCKNGSNVFLPVYLSASVFDNTLPAASFLRFAYERSNEIEAHSLLNSDECSSRATANDGEQK